MSANLENSAVATGLERSVFIPIPKKGNAKECSNYHTIALISHASKVMLKILQARLQQYGKRKRPDVQAGFRKSRGTRDQISNICWIIKKAREFQKNIYFALLTMPKPFTVWITISLGSPVQFSCSVMSDSLQPHGLQHARPPCPSLNPGVYSNSCPLSRYCHPTITSSVTPFSSHLQSFPALGSFQMSQFSASVAKV